MGESNEEIAISRCGEYGWAHNGELCQYCKPIKEGLDRIKDLEASLKLAEEAIIDTQRTLNSAWSIESDRRQSLRLLEEALSQLRKVRGGE